MKEKPRKSLVTFHNTHSPFPSLRRLQGSGGGSFTGCCCAEALSHVTAARPSKETGETQISGRRSEPSGTGAGHHRGGSDQPGHHRTESGASRREVTQLTSHWPADLRIPTDPNATGTREEISQQFPELTLFSRGLCSV